MKHFLEYVKIGTNDGVVKPDSIAFCDMYTNKNGKIVFIVKIKTSNFRMNATHFKEAVFLKNKWHDMLFVARSKVCPKKNSLCMSNEGVPVFISPEVYNYLRK